MRFAIWANGTFNILTSFERSTPLQIVTFVVLCSVFVLLMFSFVEGIFRGIERRGVTRSEWSRVYFGLAMGLGLARRLSKVHNTLHLS